MKQFFIAVFSIATLITLSQSCQKIDTTDLGGDLIPIVDNVNTFEQILDVETNNLLLGDSTKILNSEAHALGVLEDLTFGKTRADFYFGITPPAYGAYPFSKKDSLVIDSVVLSLAYTQTYGDTTSVEKFKVFEIDQTASFKDSLYLINAPDFAVVPTALGEKTVDFTTLNDAQVLKYGGDTLATNVLRIKLDTTFGRRLANYDTTGNGAYKSDSLFRTFFKGLAVKVDEPASAKKKGLAYFTLGSNTKTRLTVFYHIGLNDSAGLYTDFTFKTTNSASIVKRTIIGSDYNNNLNNAVANDDKLYIQSSPGSFAAIKIKGLDTLTNRVIHRAELIIERLPTAEDNIFPPPEFLFLDAIDSANSRFLTIPQDFINDQTTSIGYNLPYFGGYLKDNRFVFNVSRYVQGIVTLKEKIYTMRLYAPFITTPYTLVRGSTTPVLSGLLINSPVASGRVLVAGGAHPTQEMRLRIIYSKI